MFKIMFSLQWKEFNRGKAVGGKLVAKIFKWIGIIYVAFMTFLMGIIASAEAIIPIKNVIKATYIIPIHLKILATSFPPTAFPLLNSFHCRLNIILNIVLIYVF